MMATCHEGHERRRRDSESAVDINRIWCAVGVGGVFSCDGGGGLGCATLHKQIYICRGGTTDSTFLVTRCINMYALSDM